MKLPFYFHENLKILVTIGRIKVLGNLKTYHLGESKMADTYSSRPFITHDGPDETGHRAEVKVVTGYGKIFATEASGAGKSIKVSFIVENTRFKPAGWAPVDSNIMEIVNAAHAAGEPIHFRIETRRQNTVDRKIPINDISSTADLAKDNVHKSLSAVKRTDDAEWTISSFAVTNMAEDPKNGPATSANNYTLEELQKLKGDSTEESTPRRTTRRGLEGTPFETYNPDGELNPGSAAVAVPLNLYTFLVEYIKENKLNIPEKTRFLVVRAMLKACNEAQMGIYDGKMLKPDLGAGSHTRARALIFETIRVFHPLTEENMTDVQKLEKWTSDTVLKSLAMWKWSMTEVTALLK